MIEDIKNFQKYVDLCGGNFYVATTYVSKKARELANDYNNVISHSEALSWIISNKKPAILNNYDDILKLREQRSLSFAIQSLSNISDEDVKEAVLASIKKSKEVDHLIYQYPNVYDKYRQARVRILCRKLWDIMQTKDMLD